MPTQYKRMNERKVKSRSLLWGKWRSKFHTESVDRKFILILINYLMCGEILKVYLVFYLHIV